jgi:hypothetical protein
METTIPQTPPEPTRLAWATPQVYDLNGEKTESGVSPSSKETDFAHPAAS